MEQDHGSKTIIPIFDVIDEGWETVKDNYRFFMGLTGIVIFYTVLAGLIIGFSGAGAIAIFSASNIILKILALLGAFFILLAIFFIGSLLYSGIIRISLKLTLNQVVSYYDLINKLSLLLKLLSFYILYTILIFIGLLLFIIPGLIWATKYQFGTYFIIEDNISPFLAFKKSAEITQGFEGKLFVLSIFTTVILLIGYVFFFFGLISIPIVWMIYAFAYRRLVSIKQYNDMRKDSKVNSSEPAVKEI